LKKLPFGDLKSKAIAVIAASIGLLTHHDAKAIESTAIHLNEDNPFFQRYRNRILKPKLILKLNPYQPENSRLMSHSSHSSHESHSSHSSHSSGGYSSDSSGGTGLGIAVVGGAIVYGLYRLSKSGKDKK
jgi:hypothetical protein